MKDEFTRLTLAHNVKYLRGEAEISQSVLAHRSNISFRLVQEIEAGKGNPTLATIGALARNFKVTTPRLLSLSSIRLSIPEENFLGNAKKIFISFPLPIRFRTPDGVVFFENTESAKIFGNDSENFKPFDLLSDIASVESRSILRIQLMAEHQGKAFPLYLITTV